MSSAIELRLSAFGVRLSAVAAAIAVAGCGNYGNSILDDAPFLPANASLPSPRLILKTFKDDFDVAYREGTLFMLTMHPHISGQRSRVKYLEELIEYMKSKPGVWFATAEEIARYVKTQSAGTQ